MSTRIPKPFGIDPASSAFRRAALFIGLATLGVAALAVLWWFLPVADWLRSFTGWVRDLGPLGMAVFGLICVLAHLVMAPASLFYVAAGLIYGRFGGFALAGAAAALASVISFFAARSLARERVVAWLDGQARLEALDQAVRDEGWKAVLLLRLSPMIPGPAQAYLFGLTSVPLVVFVPATIAGAAPWVLLFAWIGSAGSAALRTGEEALGAEGWALMAGGVALVGAVAWLLARRAKKHLEAYDLT